MAEAESESLPDTTIVVVVTVWTVGEVVGVRLGDLVGAEGAGVLKAMEGEGVGLPEGFDVTGARLGCVKGLCW